MWLFLGLQEEYLQTLADELPDLFEDFSSLPPRVTDSLPEDGAQVEVSRLCCGDTLGVRLMKPLDDEAAEAVSKGMAAATASRGVTRSKSVRSPSFSSPSSPSSSQRTHEDGSALMAESLMAATDCEVILDFHSFFSVSKFQVSSSNYFTAHSK